MPTVLSANRSVPLSLPQIIVTGVLATVILIVAGVICWNVVHTPSSEELAAIRAAFLPQGQPYVQPKTQERAVYALLAALSPLAVLLSAWLVCDRGWPSSRGELLAADTKLVSRTWVLVIVFLLLMPLVVLDSRIVRTYSYFSRFAWLGTTYFAFIFFVVIHRALLGRRFRSNWPVLLLATACVAMLYATRVFRFEHLLAVDASGAAAPEFNVVFYSVVLGYHGYAFTTAGAPQYGFYGYLLAPIFHVVGLSIFAFTLVLFILHATAYLGVIRAGMVLIRDPMLRMVLTVFLCGLTGAIIINTWDPYLQYFPIRFIAPAFSLVGLVVSGGRRFRPITIWLCSLVVGALVFWNLDSGITSAIAWVATFAFVAACETVRRRSLAHRHGVAALIAVSGVAIGAVLVFTWIALSHGAPTQLSDWFRAQRIFYYAGFFMIPIPRGIHEWQLIAGIYVAGLCMSTPQIALRHARSLRAMLTLHLTVLGIGLFSYYQGRSVDGNMVAPNWPALILLLVFADRILVAMRRQGGVRRYWFIADSLVAAPVALCVCLVATPLIHGRLLATRLSLPAMPRAAVAPSLASGAALLRAQREKGRAVQVFSTYEAALYAQAGVAPAYPIPSSHEYFLQSDTACVRNILAAHPEIMLLAGDEKLEPVREESVDNALVFVPKLPSTRPCE